ncbi:MAG: hypothetical protein KGL39_26775 [Patescibacteria group bacterium]|nr:hypothetical protein [Patescibacteria group bacterium]
MKVPLGASESEVRALIAQALNAADMLRSDAATIAKTACHLRDRKVTCNVANPKDIEERRAAQHQKMVADPGFATRLDSPDTIRRFFEQYDMALWRDYGCQCEKTEADMYFAAVSVAGTRREALWERNDHEKVGLTKVPDSEL